MKLRSIRWQLPLSYAAIALLAALALGAVLVFTVQGYYQRQERTYLEGNAQMVGQTVAQMIEEGYSDAAIQDLLDGISSLIQVRIRLLDIQGEQRVDTGMPRLQQVITSSRGPGESDVMFSFNGNRNCAVPPGANPPDSPGQPADCPIPAKPVLIRGLSRVDETRGEVVAGSRATMSFAVVSPVGASLYGFDLTSTAPRSEGRSNQVVGLLVKDASGEILGSIELSGGPAYGREIVNSVVRALVIAGVSAVLLAALVGWFFSRRMTRPILSLAQATHRMAEGDLSARAQVSTPEEIAGLSRSFNEMAEQVGEMISTLRNFVSDAAHELHTPLTALRTNLELISGDPQNSAAFAGEALQQADRLQNLVNGLLDLSRIEAQKQAQALLDLPRLLQALSEPYASQAEQAGLAFELHLPEGALEIRGNEAQLRSAVGNLLENAIKFTPAGGQVKLGLEAGSEEARVWVEDTGIGIPPEDRPALFSRFHRARNAAGYPGNGLGLAIVRAVAEAHDGSIQVESRAQGTKFKLRLPRG